MSSFRAFRVHEREGGLEARLDDVGLDDLAPGDVVIRAAWSGINYKDALAVTGKGRIMRRFPMVAGVDVSGTVESSSDPRFAPGDRVLVAGGNLGETIDGGYAERVRVPAGVVVPLPDGLSAREAMALGTAGFTAALAVERMEANGQRPENGPVLVNGATGGVGSFAIDMLAGRGYEVAALTGKAESAGWLESLGAARVVLRGEVDMSGGRPLERALWAGAVDNVGGDQLGWLTRTVMPAGNIASIGLVGGVKLTTTVMPFILRGGEPARHQLRHHLSGAARARLEPVRDRSQAPTRRCDRDPRGRARRTARGIRRLYDGGRDRSYGGAHRRRLSARVPGAAARVQAGAVSRPPRPAPG